MAEPTNPFLVSSYVSPPYFCDRIAETNLLGQHFLNGVNTTLFSIRRLGKTGLIKHVFNKFKTNKKIACLYVDIYNTSTLKDFTNELATAIYNEFPVKKGIGKTIIDAILSLRPTISYDGISGNPEISLDFAQPKQYEKTILQLLTFLDSQSVKVLIAIDEFQQILSYPEKNVEAILRTYIQQLKNINFIFCGSNQKMMHELFNNAKRPFFASCTNMHLGNIPSEQYTPFIQNHFKAYKKTIDKESIDHILNFTLNHTFYTQFLCNTIFATGLKKITLANVKQTCSKILMENEHTYFQYRNLLTKQQWALLKAVAKEEKAQKVNSKDFMRRYHFSNASAITRGIEALLDKEMLYWINTEEQQYYAVYDKFLLRWLQHQ